MNSNIDLTENNDFTRTPWQEKLDSLFKSKFPWKPFLPINFIAPDDVDKGAILQGDAKTRKFKKLSLLDETHCDCCGKLLYPYNSTSLCKRCESIVYSDSWNDIFGES